MATMNISLPDKMKEWVEARIAEGHFSNASDFVRELIRKEQSRQRFVAEIQTAVDEGDASGYVPFSPDELFEEIFKKAEKDAA